MGRNTNEQYKSTANIAGKGNINAELQSRRQSKKELQHSPKAIVAKMRLQSRQDAMRLQSVQEAHRTNKFQPVDRSDESLSISEDMPLPSVDRQRHVLWLGVASGLTLVACNLVSGQAANVSEQAIKEFSTRVPTMQASETSTPSATPTSTETPFIIPSPTEAPSLTPSNTPEPSPSPTLTLTPTVPQVGETIFGTPLPTSTIVANTVDQAFALTPEYNESHSLDVSKLSLDDDHYVESISKMDWAYTEFGQEFLDYSHVYEMTQLSVEGENVPTVHMGIHNSEFDPNSRENFRMAFSLVRSQEELVQKGRVFSQSLVLSTDEGREGLLDFDGNLSGAVSDMFVQSSDGLKRARISGVEGTANFVIESHGIISQVVKDLPGSQTPELQNQITRRVIFDIFERHWTTGDESFDVRYRNPDGSYSVVATYNYPEESCLVQKTPATDGTNNPSGQNRMLLQVPVLDQEGRTSYATLRRNPNARWNGYFVVNSVAIAKAKVSTFEEMVLAIENNIQFLPLVEEADGVQQIPLSFEVASENAHEVEVWETVWRCLVATGRGERTGSQSQPAGIAPAASEVPGQPTSDVPETTPVLEITATPKPEITVTPADENTPEPTATVGVAEIPSTLVFTPPPTEASTGEGDGDNPSDDPDSVPTSAF